MTQNKIAVAIIAKNEERHIAPCINSVKGWADEIIVVDGFSIDRTAEIAQGLGAKVVRHAFEGDFSKERNIAMEHAASDWVLHIDADDRVTDAFKKRAKEIIGRDAGINIYKFKRKNYFLGHFMEHGGWYHYVPNLVRRSSVRFEGELHERPMGKGATGVIEADIEHYPFDTIESFITRHNRYSSIEAARIFAEKGVSEFKSAPKKAVFKTFRIFWKMYVKKKGYKEGAYGFLFAVLFAFTNFLIWMKYWELCIKNKERKK